MSKLSLSLKLNLLAIGTIFAVALAVSAAGVFTIDLLTRSLGEKLMNAEVRVMLAKLGEAHDGLIDSGVADVKSYVQNTQGEFLAGLKNYRMGENGRLYILADNGNMIFTAGDRRISDFRPDDVQRILAEPSGLIETEVAERSSLVALGAFRPWGWHLALVMPTMEINAQRNQFLGVVLLILLVCVAIGGILFAWVAGRFVRPILFLSHKMSLIAEENLGERLEFVNSSLEVTELQRSFELMTHRLHNANAIIRTKQKELGDERERLEHILNITGTGIDIVDGEFNLQFVDKGWQKLYGDPAGRKCYEYFDSLSEPCHGCGIPRALEKKQVVVTEKVLPRENNRIVEVHSIPFQNAEGQWLVAEFNVDITRRQQAEEKRRELEDRLQRSEKMEVLGTLAGGVAHDLNNTLGIIIGYSELLSNSIDESSPLRPKVANIMKGGERAAAIVQDFLTLARRGVQTRSAVNIKSIVMNFLKTPEYERILSYNPRTRVNADLQADILNIMGSEIHLHKTIMNLVSNASEAMPDGGCLNITMSNQYLDRPICGYDDVREGEYVVLSISDTGKGISPNDIRRIFEPFYTKKVMGRGGTGLGLAVVWGTVKDHDGYIDVQSEEGKGTTFNLYFPVTREEISDDKISLSLSECMGKGESVLVVDDVEGQRDLASEMLSKLNYSVTTFPSGEAAVEYLKTNSVDILVLDMIMDPGMDGLDTYKEIIRLYPGQKAIIVSGFSESERAKEAHRLGAGAYVRKPYIMQRLGLAVRKELDS